MRHFYNIDTVNFGGIVGDGTDQTIAIVDVYDDPNALSDLQHFDSYYGLPDPPSFKQYNQNGQLLQESGGTALPPSRGKHGNGWQIEESLDIEWAHVIAPAANIALVEANSAFNSDLYTAVSAAAGLAHVISMSWGGNESSGESSSDSTFAAAGVTYLAATGDNGAAQTSYPAASVNVIAVGGTTISPTLGSGDGTYTGEIAWSSTGGDISPYEPKPSYQNAVLAGTQRGTPDVSMDADPNTGVAIYDSYDFGTSAPWAQYGGTSLSTPLWAGLIAIVNQGRATLGMSPLSGRNQALPMLYSAASGNFHDITSGSNGGGNNAGPGYDTVTGIGTPVANKLLNTLAGVAPQYRLAFTQQPLGTTAGAAIDSPGGVKVSVQDAAGHLVNNDSSTVTLTLTGGTFAGGGTMVSTTAINGVATFSNLVINAAGSYTLTAGDGSYVQSTSASFNINPASANKLVIATGPTNTMAGVAISPSVVVDVEDQFGNLATTDNSTVTMTVASGPGLLAGTTMVQASSGVATFSNLLLTAAGTYSLRPHDNSLTTSASSNFTVAPAAAAALAFVQQPTDTTTGNAIAPAVTVSVKDQFGNLVTTPGLMVTLTLSTGVFSNSTPTASATASGGNATFSGLRINNAGSYTLSADTGAAPAVTSALFTVSMVDVINAASMGNTITLTQDPDLLHIDWISASTTGVIPINDPAGLSINGDGGNDTIFLNYAGGNPLPNLLHLNGTFTIKNLQGTNPLAGTALEIGKSTVYISYSNSSPIAAIQSYLAAGYNNGLWNGTPTSGTGVITSAAAQANPGYMIGYADSADGVVTGQPVNTIELKYTLGGDLTLSGTVNFADFATVVSNFNNPASWDTGAITYGATVSFADFAVLVSNYGQQAMP
jgi:hypothetical protein